MGERNAKCKFCSREPRAGIEQREAGQKKKNK